MLTHCRKFVTAISGALPIVCVAQSSVTVYGILDTNVRRATNVSVSGGSQTSVDDGYFSGSRLGFKGSEDLGDGLRATYALEMGFDPSNGTLQQATGTANYGQAATVGGRVFGRESWVGLSSKGLGTVSLGRQYTPAHLAAARVQPQGNSNSPALAVLSPHHITRQDNMVVYDKAVGAVGLRASYTISEGNGKAIGIAATYSVPDLDVVAYAQNLSDRTGREVREIRGLGAAFRVASAWKFWFAAMTRRDRLSGEHNNVATGAITYDVSPSLTLTASAASDRQNAFGATQSGSRTLTWLAANYYLSKRTEVYIGADRNRITGGYVLPSFIGRPGTQTGMVVGMRHKF